MAGCRPRDGHSSGTPVAGRLKRPTRTASLETCRGLRPTPSLFGFTPGGVYHAGPVAGPAVGSYSTLSPLPGRSANALPGGLLSVALSLGSPPPAVSRHRVSVEPGLSSPAAFRRLPERPSGRLTARHGIDTRVGQEPNVALVSSMLRVVLVEMSAMPSTSAGRKWRWKARTTAAVPASNSSLLPMS